LKKNKDKQSAYIAAEFYATNGPTINKQNFTRYNVFGKYNLSLSDRTQFTGSLSAFKSKWDASGQVPERAVETERSTGLVRLIHPKAAIQNGTM
jgi:hypothetical protein